MLMLVLILLRLLLLWLVRKASCCLGHGVVERPGSARRRCRRATLGNEARPLAKSLVHVPPDRVGCHVSGVVADSERRPEPRSKGAHRLTSIHLQPAIGSLSFWGVRNILATNYASEVIRRFLAAASWSRSAYPVPATMHLRTPSLTMPRPFKQALMTKKLYIAKANLGQMHINPRWSAHPDYILHDK